MSVVPLGLNRVSVPLQMNKSYNNVTTSQALLSKYNTQIQTQRQYQYGSDSPYYASTTLGVQADIERKAQNSINLKTTQSYLSATDSTMAQYSSLMDEVRGMALDAVNTTTSDKERASLAETTKTILQQMFDFGNYSYEGRYVFAGSTTGVTPFEWGTDSYSITYRGSEHNIYSWSDTDILSQSNMNGVDVFGAISNPVRGSIDVNPRLDESTRLSDLNGEQGVEKGTIRFTYLLDDRTVTQEVDLSKCATIGDVVKTIESMNNPNFSVNVDLSDQGLVFSVPQDTTGRLFVSEVGKGTIARQLGIPVNEEFSVSSPLVGRDINPALTSTTDLGDLLGSKASLKLRFAGANNDITLQAKHNGETYADAEGRTWDLNGVSVAIHADVNTEPGSETATFDSETNQITIQIHPDNTSANDIIKAVNKASEAGDIPPFEAKLTGTDETRPDLAGTGLVSFLPGTVILDGQTQGGDGVDFDKKGLEIVNGNETFYISFENCKTVGDVLAELNDPRYGLQATVNDKKNGIDIRTRVSGADFCIGENGGITAHQLGLRTADLDTKLSELDFGRGVNDYDGPGTPAKAQYNSVTPNSGLLLTAKNEGKDWNDYTLNFVPTSDPQGNVIVSMDEDNKIINIGIVPGTTTACEIVEAFNSQPGPKQYFDLALDDTDGVNTGQGVVYDGSTKTSGGTDGGIDFTITRNDGTVMEIDIKGAETLGDILDIINRHPDNADGLLVATLSKTGNGIELTDKTFGESMTRVDRTLLSTAAIELGLINEGEEYRSISSAVANGENGKYDAGEGAFAAIAFDDPNSSLLIKAKQVGSYANDYAVEFVAAGDDIPVGFTFDSSSKRLIFAIEPGVTTANDIVNMFKEQASPQVQSMFEIQNGTTPDGQPSDGSGLIDLGDMVLEGGSDRILTGFDPNPKEAESLFTALIRLQLAMEKNDNREIERATQLLDKQVDQMNEARATVGVMQNSLDNVQDRLADEYVQHEATLNTTLRIDFADASVNYMAQQVSYQAALQVTSAMFQMSLLNYL